MVALWFNYSIPISFEFARSKLVDGKHLIKKSKDGSTGNATQQTGLADLYLLFQSPAVTRSIRQAIGFTHPTIPHHLQSTVHSLAR